MQSIDTSDLKELDRDLAEILSKLPGKRRELHARLGTEAKAQVDAALPNSTRVKGWQEKYIGSRGGYAAVRPQKGYISTKREGNQFAYRYITNALENGHRTRGPSGKAKRRRPTRAEHVSVAGKHFYSTARENMESRAVIVAEEFVSELKKEMEG